jgi:hypothetical protein
VQKKIVITIDPTTKTAATETSTVMIFRDDELGSSVSGTDTLPSSLYAETTSRLVTNSAIEETENTDEIDELGERDRLGPFVTIGERDGFGS